MSNLIDVGGTTAHWSVNGDRILKYSIELFHKGLNERKLLSAPSMELLQNKAELQADRFKEKWKKKQLINQRESNIGEAEHQNKEAEDAIEELKNVLTHTLSIDDTVDWDSLKKNDKYPVLKPSKPNPKEKINYIEESLKSIVEFTILDKLFKSRQEKKVLEQERIHKENILAWKKKNEKIDIQNQKNETEYLGLIENWNKKVDDWENEYTIFYSKQDEFNSKIDALKNSYMAQDVDAVVEYCDMVLNNSEYPESFPKSYEIEYNPENKILIIEYQLPSIDSMPRIKSVKYIASRKEIVETQISDRQLNQMFDDTIFQIALRSIHELFEADVADAISAVSFNGWVTAINKATGNEENNCILSLQSQKEEFLNINLGNIDPKACFRSLKGVASSKLSSLTPVKPILQISKTDKRFVEGYDVADSLDSTTNIAAMDWEDFEHLVRELFEKEFAQNGGEVKVTQASRDGGVDAIAFDPDPIRGGKIVIQAKRYTNTVGVAAVRDLYGTVVNEGATKGILVSTADYGPDAYSFAQDKPLTLLSGSNLLHLLEKHGYHAKIDLREAKEILANK